MVFGRKLRAMASDYRRDRNSYRAAAAELPEGLRIYLMVRGSGLMFFMVGVALVTPSLVVLGVYWFLDITVAVAHVSAGLPYLRGGGMLAFLGLAFWFSAVRVASDVAKSGSRDPMSGDRANPPNDLNTPSK